MTFMSLPAICMVYMVYIHFPITFCILCLTVSLILQSLPTVVRINRYKTKEAYHNSEVISASGWVGMATLPVAHDYNACAIQFPLNGVIRSHNLCFSYRNKMVSHRNFAWSDYQYHNLKCAWALLKDKIFSRLYRIHCGWWCGPGLSWR